MTQDASSEALRKLVEGQRFVMMTTRAADGALVSRPMTVQEVDDWVFRFITQDDNAVTSESDGQQVNLAVMDGNTYVSVSGTGRVERDVAKKRELWDRLTEAYAGQPDDPANVILEITAESGEYWDGGNPVAHALSLAKAALTGERPGGGDHGTADL